MINFAYVFYRNYCHANLHYTVTRWQNLTFAQQRNLSNPPLFREPTCFFLKALGGINCGITLQILKAYGIPDELLWTQLLRRPTHVSGYFWILNFFFPDTASVITYRVNPTYESATFWFRSPEWKFFNTLKYFESGIVWTLNPDIFNPVT